jgi:hypothetical protein
VPLATAVLLWAMAQAMQLEPQETVQAPPFQLHQAHIA